MTGFADVNTFCELSQAKARYCRSLDTRDWDSLAALMSSDIQFGMTDGKTEPEMTCGRDETLYVLRTLVAGTTTVHHVHVPEIELVGSRAHVVWAVEDRVVFNDGLTVSGFGYYDERWVRKAGAWQVEYIKLTHLLTEIRQPDICG